MIGVSLHNFDCSLFLINNNNINSSRDQINNFYFKQIISSYNIVINLFLFNPNIKKKLTYFI